MSELLRFFKDMRDNGYGLAEIAAQLGTSAIAEPVAGFAAMYDPQNGAEAIREGMTYQPRSQAAKDYSQSIGNAAKTAIKPAMPIIDTWKKGVDIAGQYSPVVGAGLRTVPTAIGIAMGAKPALQAGRQVSNSLGAMQGRMVANANAPRTLNTGYMGQRGVFAGINALTADKEALAKAQEMIRQGVEPAKVWHETGWGQGADGKWRFEISDDAAKLVNVPVNKSWEQFANAAETEKYGRRGANVSSMSAKEFKDFKKWRAGLEDEYNKTNATMRPLSEIFQHEQAASAYPDVYNSLSAHWDASMGKNGSFGNGKIAFGDVSNQEGVKGLFGHELQHAIQQREGFARGGNPEQFIGKLFSKEQIQDARILSQMMSKGKTLDEALKEYKTLIRKDPESGAVSIVRYTDNIDALTHEPFEAYKRLAGEVEARTTQSRLNLDSQQRRDNYPFDFRTYGYDRPAKSQTVDFGNNKAMSQRPLTEFDYRDSHRAPSPQDNAAAHSMNDVYPDIYSTKGLQYYGTGEPFDRKTFQIINSLKNNPDKKITIYRAIPDDINADINAGDWVGITPEYAKMHGDSRFDGKYKILKKEVKASEIHNNGDSIHEWGYNPSIQKPEIHTPKKPLTEFEQAQFDPMQRQSSNLLAQSAKLAPTTALGAYMYNEKRKKSQGNQ